MTIPAHSSRANNRHVRAALYRSMATRLERGIITAKKMATILRHWADTEDKAERPHDKKTE